MDPDPQFILQLTIIFVSIIASAFFSGIEIAYISANKLMIEFERKNGVAPSAVISYYFNNPAQFMTTMLLGNILSLVVFAMSLSHLLDLVSTQYFPISRLILMAFQVLFAALIILLFSKYLPRALFRNNPNKILTWCILPISILYWSLYPFTWLIMSISRILMQLIVGNKHKKRQEPFFMDKIDLDNYVVGTLKRKQHSLEDERNMKLLNNALDFSQIKIRECIVPRTQLVAVSVTDSVEHLRQKFTESGNSKILVYDGSIDNIIGYIHHSKLFEVPVSNIKRMMKDVPFVPETMSAQMLLSIFVKSNKNIAVVVDEFGGTTGIVTIEDIMEEIFGEITDEHDKGGLVDKRLSDREYEFSGRVEIDHINEHYGLKIETSDEYETIAGFVLHKNGSIPKLNETITFGTMIFTILEVSPTRIERLRLKLNGETN